MPRHHFVTTPMQEKLNLRIGMYQDWVSFLMAPIEGCDVILGMSWHYRIHPISDFVEKILTLTVEGKKIIVYADAGDWPFPLCNEDDERIEFLEKYNDCFTESLPDRLPLERPEDHKIDLILGRLSLERPEDHKTDLILGSLPPNQPPYRETRLDFELAEGLYAQALIPETQTVCLWLGANVMLEYNCDEAEALLRKNLENAHISLQAIIEDMQFLRDQVTITEVTIARVFNWDVHQRRKKRQASGESSA
ncbi:hypothetical protein L7F22_047869 [Adiantum nelumboides]|nr:hypothetical protein [Adiantum nelumboides]